MSIRNLFPTLIPEQSTRSLFSQLNNEMTRIFDEFETGNHSLEKRSGSESFLSAKMDCSETDELVEVKIEIPGVKEEDIDVELNGRLLTISGKREARSDEKQKDYRIIERESGSFVRRLNLDFDADPKKVNAQIEAGVLTVAIEKPEETKSKKQKIEIKPKKAVS